MSSQTSGSHVKPGCSVAFIGAGAMAREHARALRDVPGVHLAGIWNRTRARAESVAAEYSIPIVCDSIGELYQRTVADLVVIAVLETAARATAIDCFTFPWTVLMEKPPGLNLADAHGIQGEAQARGRRVLVAMNRRFFSSTLAARHDLDARPGARFIHVQDQQDVTALGQYNYPEAVLSNWMYANSIHLVDYLRHFGRGAVNSVRVIQPWNRTDPGVVVAAIEFESGDTGLYTALWNGPGPWMVSVSTASRRWELRPLEQAHFQNRDERQLQPVLAAEWDTLFKPGFRLQAEHAVRAATGQLSDSATLDDVVQTMELIGRIYDVEGLNAGH